MNHLRKKVLALCCVFLPCLCCFSDQLCCEKAHGSLLLLSPFSQLCFYFRREIDSQAFLSSGHRDGFEELHNPISSNVRLGKVLYFTLFICFYSRNIQKYRNCCKSLNVVAQQLLSELLKEFVRTFCVLPLAGPTK